MPAKKNYANGVPSKLCTYRKHPHPGPCHYLPEADPTDDSGFARSLGEASVRVEALHAELRDAYPALRGTLAIPGVFVGHGLGSFVANGMTDDQIVMQVLTITTQIRHGTVEQHGNLTTERGDAR